MKIKDFVPFNIYKPLNSNVKEYYRVTNDGLEHKFQKQEWSISTLSYNKSLTEEFIKVERKIDWSKVPFFTKVRVRNKHDNTWKYRYFMGHLNNKFKATMMDDFVAKYEMEIPINSYDICEIYEDIDIEDDWYEEI